MSEIPDDFMRQIKALEDFAKQRLSEKRQLMIDRAAAIDLDMARTQQQLKKFGVTYEGKNPDV